MSNRAAVRKLIYQEVSSKTPNMEAVYCLSKEMTQEKIKQIMQKELPVVRK